MSVRFRVPVVDIDAVQDSSEVSTTGPQQPIHSFAALRCANFGRIGGTDSRNLVSERDAGLQQIQAPPHFHLIHIEEFPVHSG